MANSFDNKITYLVGDECVLNDAACTPALSVFSDEMVGFLSELSKELMAVPGIRNHQDVMSYAYWIRKASLEQARTEAVSAGISRLGRGVAYHIAPSNVPVNFAVSMTSSLLAGNVTVIRVSNKEFEEVDIICSAINRVLDKEAFSGLKKYICIVRYEHSDEITSYLSGLCDVRIIWGGNRTIEQIRQYPIPPRAIEMCFADRHSVAVIDIDSFKNLNADEKRDVAKKFYTDTYYTDQNACSSPRIVVWLNRCKSGETGGQVVQDNQAVVQVQEFRDIQKSFWDALEEEVSSRYEMQPIQAVDKMSIFTELSMKQDGVYLERRSNKLFIVTLDNLSDDVMDYKMGGGYFFQFTTDSLSDIIPIMGKMCQTVAVLGLKKNEVVDFVMSKGVRGVDRVVDIGDTMGLEFTWDGYRMIEAMSRVVYVYER